MLGDSTFCELDPSFITVALLQSINPSIDDIAEFEIAYENSGAIDTFLLGYETGDWTGNVLEDTDGDGDGDVAIPGVTITLFQDLDGDGVLTQAEINNQPTPPLVDVTDSNGDYSFTGLFGNYIACLLYTSPSPRDQRGSRMPSSA